jgi:hypothetical protein
MSMEPKATTLAKALLRVAELREASWMPNKDYVDDRRRDPQIAGLYTKTEEACRAKAWAESGLTTPWLRVVEMLFANSKNEALAWAGEILRAETQELLDQGALGTYGTGTPLVEVFRRGPPERIANALEKELARRRESGEDDPEMGVMYKGVSFR